MGLRIPLGQVHLGLGGRHIRATSFEVLPFFEDCTIALSVGLWDVDADAVATLGWQIELPPRPADLLADLLRVLRVLR